MDEVISETGRVISSGSANRLSRRSVLKLAAGAVGALTISPLLEACQTAPTPSGGASAPTVTAAKKERLRWLGRRHEWRDKE